MNISVFPPISGSGGSSYDEVATFANLPTASTQTGKNYIVTTTTGIIYLNRKLAGIYRSDGTNWVYLGDIATYALVDHTHTKNQITDFPTITNGVDGKSAYQLAVDSGFIGNISAWLSSLIGATGAKGDQGIQGLKGDTGAQGIQGVAGTNGTNGQGVPTGGTAGQVLSKIDSTNYNSQWVTPSASSFVNTALSSPDCNTIITNGFYACSGTPTNAPRTGIFEMIVTVSGSTVTQFVYANDGSVYARYYNGTSWSSWANTSGIQIITTGTEYVVDQILDSKQVYGIQFSLGSMPNSTTKTVAIPNYNSAYLYWINYGESWCDNGSGTRLSINHDSTLHTWVSGSTISIATSSNFSSFINSRCTLHYTK